MSPGPLRPAAGARRRPTAALPAALAGGVLSLAAGWGGSAQAQPAGEASGVDEGPVPRALVVRAAVADDEVAEDLALHVAERLRDHGWALRRPAPPPAPAPERDALARARDAYDRLRPDAARQILDDVLRRAEATGGAGLDAQGVRELYLDLALVALAVGDGARADEALARLAAAAPGFVPDDRLYPPALRARFAEVPRTESRALLEIDTAEEALVWVDGRPLPAGARRVSLPLGPHLVRAAAGGYEPAGRLVEVTAGAATVPLPLTPDDEARLARPGPPGGPPSARLREAAARLGVGLLLLDVLRRDGGVQPVARLEDVPTGRAAEVLLAPGATSDEGAARLVEALRSARPEGASPDPLPWVLGGAAVLAAAVAVVLGVVLVGDREDPPQAFDLRWEGP